MSIYATWVRACRSVSLITIDDPAQGPVVRWRGHANLLFTNWLNYYVYQETPYRIEDIQQLGDLR